MIRVSPSSERIHGFALTKIRAGAKIEGRRCGKEKSLTHVSESYFII